MIRITIGGEEVVSNKEFTITEEMLATSSTILNNCYPKAWETSHDYVNNFYYPQDYSKCLIYKDIPLLPEGYTQLEYIQSTSQTYNTNYIDTNIYPTNNTSIEIVFEIIDSQLGYGRMFGSSDLFRNEFTSTYYLNNYWNGVRYYNSNAITMNTQHTIKQDKNLLYFDNNLIQTFTSGTFEDANSLRLFSSTVGNRDSKNLRIYSCKIWEDEVLIREFIPCYRNVDNSIGLYDLVNNEFYSNQGNIKFLGGNENIETISELIFSGIVKNTGNISLRPQEPKYCSLQILDFKDFLSQGDYLDFVISNKTVSEAIQMVVDEISQYGFVLGNVNIIGGNDVIGAYSTQEKSAYDVFQYLADITQSRWTTRMIDENTVAIDFYDPTLMPQGIDIDYTNEFFETYQVNDLSFSYGTRDYRNKQVMLSDQVYGGTDYIDTILGDGYNTSFITTANIGLIKSIYVNGVEVSFATNEDKELGIDADFYYTPGENTISAETSYSAGTQIAVTYTPLIRGREVIYNTDEVQRINSQIGRKGVIARYEQRNDILTSDNLEKVGQAYIKYKGSAEIILTLSTLVDIYNVGEIVNFNAPITELDTNYMVKKKSTQIIATGDYSNVFYTYELTSSFNSESAINYFDNQRNKTTGNIAPGQYINRNVDIEASANIIWDNLTITEVTVTGDNVLNSPLNSPFVE